MSNYKKKFTLTELYASGLLNDILPQPSKRNKYVTESNKKETKVHLKNKIGLNDIERQLIDVIASSSHTFKRGSVSKGAVHIYLKVANESEYVQEYNNIIKAVKGAKARLSYVNMFTNEIESALRYSTNLELNGKNAPKLSLRLNDISEIKGMSDLQKRNLAYNIVECILFDDDFKNVQNWNGLKGNKMNGYARYNPSQDNPKYRLYKTLKREYDERNE